MFRVNAMGVQQLLTISPTISIGASTPERRIHIYFNIAIQEKKKRFEIDLDQFRIKLFPRISFIQNGERFHVHCFASMRHRCVIAR